MEQQRIERARVRQREEETGLLGEQEMTETVMVGINNLRVEVAGTEEEAEEGLVADL